MEHPQTFLMKKMAGYETNGFNSLGHLNGKHVKDIAEVMKQFAAEAIIDVIGKLNSGAAIDINGTVYALKKLKKIQN